MHRVVHLEQLPLAAWNKVFILAADDLQLNVAGWNRKRTWHAAESGMRSSEPFNGMRLTLVISSLSGGGAERVMSILAGAWASRGEEVTLLSMDDGKQPGYSIEGPVQVRRLAVLGDSRHLFEGLFRNLQRVRVLRRAIRNSRADIVISFMDKTNVLTLLATRRLGLRVIVAEHADPAHYEIGRAWSWLRRLVYPWASALVCPTDTLCHRFQAFKVRGLAIPNPVVVPPDPAPDHKRERASSPSHTLVAMGRLSSEKGFDLLLNAFSRVAQRHPDWTLTILGWGPLLAELQSQAESLNLKHRVHFAGGVSDPFSILRAADLFVFPSRFEAFGMALAEAMGCGLPVVSFACSHGPIEIVRDGVDGILVPPEDIAAMAATLDRLMRDAGERQRLAARAPEVLERFSRQRVLDMWQQLFDSLPATE